MTEPKRRPGRPKSDTPPDPDHNVRMSTDRWKRLGEATQRAGTDRTKALNDYAAWYTHEDGAKRPNRPPAEDEND